MITKFEKNKGLSQVLILYLAALVLLTMTFWLNNDFIIYGLVGFLAASIMLLPIEKAILFVIMIISIGDMITLSRNYTTSIFGVILVVFVIKCFCHLRIKRNAFVLYCIFAIYMVAGLRIGQDSLFSDVQTIVNYLVLYLIAAEFDCNRTRQYFDAFICGHFIATISSLLIRHTERYSIIASENSVHLLNADVARFSGMQSDPNFFALFCIVVVSILLYMFANKSYGMSTRNIVFMIIVYLMFGVASLSKMFMIAMLIIALYFYLAKSRVALWKKIISVLVFSGLYILINFYMDGELYDMIFGRFLNLNLNYGTRINALTTGRYQIWMAYINDWTSSPEKILFGVGLANKRLEYVGKMHHQFFIELLYQFGIIGTSIFFCYLGSIYRLIKDKINNSSVILEGTRLSAVGIVVILFCGLTLGLFALNVTIYIIFFALLFMAISKKEQ